MNNIELQTAYVINNKKEYSKFMNYLNNHGYIWSDGSCMHDFNAYEHKRTGQSMCLYIDEDDDADNEILWAHKNSRYMLKMDYTMIECSVFFQNLNLRPRLSSPQLPNI